MTFDSKVFERETCPSHVVLKAEEKTRGWETDREERLETDEKIVSREE